MRFEEVCGMDFVAFDRLPLMGGMIDLVERSKAKGLDAE